MVSCVLVELITQMAFDTLYKIIIPESSGNKYE
jgi:hypothetical protein